MVWDSFSWHGTVQLLKIIGKIDHFKYRHIMKWNGTILPMIIIQFTWIFCILTIIYTKVLKFKKFKFILSIKSENLVVLPMKWKVFPLWLNMLVTWKF